MAFSFNKLCSNVIPAGKYKVQVTDIKFRTTGTGETSRDISVTYTISEGPMAKRVLTDTVFEKSFSFRLKPFLVAAKVDTAKEFSSADELYNYGMKEAKGKFMLIDITVRPYNGKEYNNVDNWTPISDSTTTSDDVLNSFDIEPDIKATVPANAAPKTADVKAEDAEPELDISLDDLDEDTPF